MIIEQSIDLEHTNQNSKAVKFNLPPCDKPTYWDPPGYHPVLPSLLASTREANIKQVK
jgi:hypothetical protein